jgi:molybdopterin-guanine dinucleotide biosynthesis protein A
MLPSSNLTLGAIILAGGRSSRMGVDKAVLPWGGLSAVQRVAGLARAVGARRIVTAGGDDHGFERVADPQPHAGPVAGILGGLTLLRGEAGRVLVLAVDAPTLQPADLAPLLQAAMPGAFFAGHPLPMVIDPSAAPMDAAADWALRRLAARSGLAELPLPAGAEARIRGANTPEERLALLKDIGEANAAG